VKSVEVASGAATPAFVSLEMRGRAGVRGKVVFPEDEVRAQTHLPGGHVGATLFLAPAVAGVAPEVERLHEGASAHPSAAAPRYAFLDLVPGGYVLGIALSREERLLLKDPAVTLRIGVRSRRFGVRDVALAPGARAASVRFEAPALLDDRLEGYAGTDLEGAVLLSLARLPGPGEELSSANRTESTTPDSDGRGRFGPVEPARWRAAAFLAGGRAPWLHPVISLASREVHLASGRSDLALAIPPLHSFVVLVEGAPGDAIGLALTLVHPEEGGGRVRLDVGPSRRVAFARVPPGEYTLELSGISALYEPVHIRVPGPPEVRFEAKLAPTARDPRGAR
jgi:hypothetical protein